MRTMVSALTLLVVAGCASGKWYHPSASDVQFNRDRAECDYDSEKAVATIRSGIEAGFQKTNLMKMCLQSRGYEFRRD